MRRLPLILSILVLVAITSQIFQSQRTPEPAGQPSPSEVRIDPVAGSRIPADTEPIATNHADEFRSWLRQRPDPTDSVAFASWETEGVALAEVRRRRLREWMRRDVRTALEESLRWDEWLILPATVQSRSERPFSEWARQDFYVGCDPENGRTTEELRVTRQDGRDLRAHSYGRRKAALSREKVPLQGFELDGELALLPEAVRVMTDVEASAVRDIVPPLASGDDISAWSGEAIEEGQGVAVLIGGRRGRVFSEELPLLEERLHSWEAIPGESSGVELMAAWLAAESPGEFVPLMDESFAPMASNPWTTTPKTLLLLRVDFPDLTGARESYEVLTTKLSTAVSNSLEEMSFGKTGLQVTVTPQVIRLPQVSTYYEAENTAGRNGNGQLHDHARAGAEALGYVFDHYDFWCVQFNNIGMGYGGLAIVGGKKSWIQSSGTSVFVHEFGHNYGLGHANRWEPDPVAGPLGPNGTRIDYGSMSSIMGGGPFPAGHFDAHAKAFLGWLDSTQWEEVTSSGRYRLWRADHMQSPLPHQTGALRISRVSAPGDALWLSYKRAIPERRRLERGVSVIWEKAGDPRNNFIVKAGRDGSFPETDYELPVGQTFSDGDIHITPVARGGGPPGQWVDIDIRMESTPGNSNPTASWSRLPSDEIEPFQTFRLDVSASDPEGDPLAYHWDPGDGSEVSFNGPTFIHTYRTAGVYQVSVVISDRWGGSTSLTQEFDVASEGSEWNLRSSGTTSQLNHIASSPHRAVAVSATGLVLHSTDGQTWTSYDLRSAKGLNALDLREICWNGTCFILAGRERAVSGGAWEGCIYRSTDGLTWTRTHLAGIVLYRVAYGGGLWVVSGENQTMRTSTDGITWTTVAFPVYDHIQGIAYGNGLWLVVADRNNDRTRAYTTTNFQTWTYRSWSEGFTNNQIVRPARWMAGQFYLGGFAVGLRNVSGNGQTLGITPLLSGLTINDMIAVAGGLYVVGDITEDSVLRGHVHVSSAGDSWQRLPLTELAAIRGITSFGGRLITVGNSGEIWQSGLHFAPVSDGWYAWQTAHRAVLGAEDDPFEVLPGEDLPNLYHYALGRSPGVTGTSHLPFAEFDSSGQMKLVVPRNALRQDVQYRIKRSTDLVEWTAEGVEVLIDRSDRLEARGLGPNVVDQEFLRLELDLIP